MVNPMRNRTQQQLNDLAQRLGIVESAVRFRQVEAMQTETTALHNQLADNAQQIKATAEKLAAGFAVKLDAQGIARLNLRGVAELKRTGALNEHVTAPLTETSTGQAVEPRVLVVTAGAIETRTLAAPLQGAAERHGLDIHVHDKRAVLSGAVRGAVFDAICVSPSIGFGQPIRDTLRGRVYEEITPCLASSVLNRATAETARRRIQALLD